MSVFNLPLIGEQMKPEIFPAIFRILGAVSCLVLTLNASSASAAPPQSPVSDAQTLSQTDARPVARGRVFIDVDGDGKYSYADSPFSGIRVSNGHEIVKTNQLGMYEIPVDDPGMVFVIKPNGFRTRLNRNNLPQFYYIHKPDGSPALKYPGSKPTGPLPQSIDFPLYRQTESEDFKILLFGDPQPRNHKEVDYIAHDVVRELIGKTDHAFGVTLGDIAFDQLETFDTLNQTIALIGIPWYNVIGNHDLNFDTTTRQDVNETFEATYGPTYYSFDYGQVHFVVMDNIDWVGPNDRVQKQHYEARFGTDQLKWLERDLALIPESQMVVVMMHIPIVGAADKADFFRLIEKRPYCISISGHTHDHQHLFLGKEDGFNGPQEHHHIVNVTVSGSWWSGAKDENGIPHTTMKDGAPNGYSILNFDRNGYRLDFKAAGQPASDQLRIDMPTKLPTSDVEGTDVWVNVYNGSQKSEVRVSIDGGQWMALRKRVAIDPYFQRLYERDKDLKPGLTKPRPSSHLWHGKLPPLAPGVHLMIAETTDRHGRKYQTQRSIRVVED